MSPSRANQESELTADPQLTRLLSTVENARDEIVGLLQDLVRIPSVNTGKPEDGNETEVCQLLRRRLAEDGIPSEIIGSAPGRGNLFATLGGPSGQRLMFMSHVDVVPIEDVSQWKHPPFCGDIVDNAVFGRGSDDCKSITAAETMALLLLRRAGIPLEGALRLVATADEESGGRYGIAWLAQHHPDNVRADWAINEGGGTPIQTDRGLAYLLPLGEKGRIEARFTFTGKSAHGARPWHADNALYKMGEALRRLQQYKPDLDLSVPVFQRLELFGIDEPVSAENLDQILDQLECTHSAVSRSLRGMSRMSIAPTMAAAGAKSNSIPARASLVCDVRTLPHQDVNDVRAAIMRVMEGISGLELELDVWATSNSSPADSVFVRSIRQATELALGQSIELVPSLTVGFTDSRCVRPLGTEIYGFLPLLPGLDINRAGVHGINESMEIDNLLLRTRMCLALAYLTLARR
jgi:acetylornithine deacetylase/succinyl-diaminopimelate desuccinylase-like protein